MKKQTNWIVVLILILAMAGLACNAILGDDAEPTAETTTVDPAVTEEAVDATGEGEESEGSGGAAGGTAPTLDLNPENNFGFPSDINSFRIALDIQFEETKEDGTVESGRISGTGAQVLNPQAMTFDFTFEGSDFDVAPGAASFSMTQIGDVVYVNLADAGCISTTGNEFDTSFTEFADAGSMFGGLEGATLVEENVTVNGIQTNHYQFDDSALAQGEQSFGTLQNVQGDIYVSVAEGYLVRLVMEADGQDLNLSGIGEDSFGGAPEVTTGHVIYQVDYSDFNAPIEITEPEGCAGAGDSEFPILEDATNVNSFGDLLSYNTETDFDGIVEFYQTEMVAAGYTLSSDFTSPPTALLVFEQDGQEVTVSVAENPSGAGFVVTIISG